MPVRPEGTVCGKAATASWFMTARPNRLRGLGRARAEMVEDRARRKIGRGSILKVEGGGRGELRRF